MIARFVARGQSVGVRVVDEGVISITPGKLLQRNAVRPQPRNNWAHQTNVFK